MSAVPVGPVPPPTGSAGGGLDSDLRSAARGAAVTFGGALFGTGLGFVLVLVLARQLGAAGSGLVLQAVAAFTIALAVARLGMDTAAVWVVPRLQVEDPAQVRGALTSLLVPAALVGTALPVVWYVAVSGTAVADGSLVPVVDATAWALPFAAVTLVALAATRAFGGTVPFTLIGNVALPGARPVAVLLATAAGGSVAAVGAAWALPLVVTAGLSVWVLHRRLTGFERSVSLRGPRRPESALRRRVARYAVPRTVASALEVGLQWSDVLLVGLLAGPAAAGIYGAVSRFVMAGTAVLHALRIVVAPRFSARLAAGRLDDVRALHRITTGWVLLLAAPAYVLMAWFAPTVLGLLGPEFAPGTTAVVVLCVGGIGMLAGGNVQSLLLMSGHSGRAALDTAIVFAVNFGANLLLVPVWGITGAAVSWAVCMWLDTALAALQVRWVVGIAPPFGAVTRSLAIVAACTLPAAAAATGLLGQGAAALVLAVVLGGVLLTAAAARWRDPLALGELIALVPGARARGRALSTEDPAS